MDKNELWKLYCKRDKEFEVAKGKRTILTILLFVVGYFVVIYAFEKPTDFKELCLMLFAAIVLAVIHFLVNATIFGYLATKGREEAEILERIRKRISELEKKE